MQRGVELMIEYRKAVENDKASIEALFIEMLQTIYNTSDVEGYEEGYLDRYFSDLEDIVIVAEDNGKVVAFLSVQVFRGDNYIYLDDLSVTARYREQGIGTNLIKSAEDYAKEIGISAIVFHVEISNERAHDLYERLGYKDDLKDGSRMRMAKDGLSDAFEKSCGAIVYTIEDGVIKYLLVEEASGFHSFPKGHMENGETEKETAIREIKEETDLDVTLISDFRVSEQYQLSEKPGVTKQVVYYLAQYTESPHVVRPNEVRSIKSLSLEEALGVIEHENKKELLIQADEYIKENCGK